MGKLNGFIVSKRKAWRNASTIVALLITAAGFAASAVRADTPSPAGVWIELHFTRTNGETKTIVEPVSLKRAGQVNGYCNTALPADHDIAHGAFLSHPELTGMTFVGANCQKDKAGAVKVAVGAWPLGEGPPQATRAQILAFSPKPTPALFDGPPAVILFTASVDGGKVVKGYGGWEGGVPAFYARTCDAKLTGQLPVIVNTLKGRYHFSSAKILSAKCAPFPKTYGDLLNASSASK